MLVLAELPPVPKTQIHSDGHREWVAEPRWREAVQMRQFINSEGGQTGEDIAQAGLGKGLVGSISLSLAKAFTPKC